MSNTDLEESYKEAEGLRAGVIPDWMMERARLEEQGVDFGDNMACGMVPPSSVTAKNGLQPEPAYPDSVTAE